MGEKGGLQERVALRGVEGDVGSADSGRAGHKGPKREDNAKKGISVLGKTVALRGLGNS